MFTEQQKRLILGLATSVTKHYGSTQIALVLCQVYSDFRSLPLTILEKNINDYLDIQ